MLVWLDANVTCFGPPMLLVVHGRNGVLVVHFNDDEEEAAMIIVPLQSPEKEMRKWLLSAVRDQNNIKRRRE